MRTIRLNTIEKRIVNATIFYLRKKGKKMSKLVAYFSASGVTKKLATDLAKLVEAQLVEITPEKLYTAEDLDYTKKTARCSVEMADLSCRPSIKAVDIDMNDYDTVFVGFPVWWGREPSVVDTFLDAYDFSGKKIIPFCTSGSGGIEGGAARIAELTGATVDAGIRFAADYSEEDLKNWVAGLL